MTSLSVIIPTYQRRDRLRRVLDALARQDAPPFEVIVSLDGCTDGTQDMLTTLSVPYPLRWINGPNGGPGAARHRGARLAHSDRLLFLDDDILAQPGLLAAHLDPHPNAVCFGQVRTLPGLTLSAWEAYLVARYEEHYDKLARPGYTLTFWDCLSGNLSLSRALYDYSGGFDPAFGYAKHDDIEFGYRLAQAGAHFIYRPEALGYHIFSKGHEAGLHSALIEGRSAYALAQRYPDLAGPLLEDRRSRYPAAFRWLLAGAVRHHIAVHLSRLLLAIGHRLKLPLWLDLYRAAYHLTFWQGVDGLLAMEQS